MTQHTETETLGQSPIIAEFLRSWNDALDDETRTRLLRPLVPRLVGTTASPSAEEARAWMCVDWLVRTHTPVWLRLAGLAAQADRLAGLPEFRKGMDVASVRPVIDAVRSDADAAWAAAAAAAGDAWDAPWDAAGDEAWDAAWEAPGAAAAAAAGAGAWDVAWDAAREAAWAAAWAAVGGAAGDAAEPLIAPAVTELQASALDLVDRMIEAK